MSWPSIDELDEDRQHLESLVDHTPGIDPWCSGPDWFIPAHRAFAGRVFDDQVAPRLWSRRGEAVVLLGQATTAEGVSIVSGLEPMWGFSSPFLGPDLRSAAELAASHLAEIDDWDLLVANGLPLSTDLARELAEPFRSLGDVRFLHGIVRQVADLAGGHPGWFGARSARFRQSLRRLERQAAGVGLRFIDVSTDHDAYSRCVAIERASWKGRIDDGITAPGMHRFYEIMVGRLAAEGRLRATVAVLDHHDVGYIFGGVRNGRYRGLQLSFDESVRDLSVSHLLQHRTIERLVDEGVHTYDMGMDMDYKRRWADRTEPSMSLVVRRPGLRGRRLVR